MRIQINDVDHGNCVTVTSPSGHVLMLDCGYSISRPWFPALAHSGRRIQTLILQNLDEDHTQDLPRLWQNSSIGSIVSNPTVTANALHWMKAGKLGNGVQHAHDILAALGAGAIGEWRHDLGGVHWQAFYNRYLYDFTDTNNLSLAVFVRWSNFTILLGGDMECAGWEKLLMNPIFVARLSEVKIYVASHHGRENGKCEALFRHMRPDVVIFSDGPKQHATQETRGWYAARVNGIVDNSKVRTASRPVLRQVMTTRSDGTLDVQVNTAGGYTVYYERSEPTIEEIIAALVRPRPTFAGLISAQ